MWDRQLNNAKKEFNMPKPNLTITDHPSRIRIVEIDIPGAITTREQFAEAVTEVSSKLPGDYPVFLTGRSPIWGYAMLVHAAHPTPAVGVYEPRELGYVIVASHDVRFVVGQLVLEADM
jgi:CRISPR-associated protein Csx3